VMLKKVKEYQRERFDRHVLELYLQQINLAIYIQQMFAMFYERKPNQILFKISNEIIR
jgi:hypothetical protein